LSQETKPATEVVPAFARRHYTITDLSAAWKMCDDKVRSLFRDEPGVLRLGEECSTGRRRRYQTLRIPEEVVQRVYLRLQTRNSSSKGKNENGHTRKQIDRTSITSTSEIRSL
jgi:hypothetical protein